MTAPMSEATEAEEDERYHRRLDAEADEAYQEALAGSAALPKRYRLMLAEEAYREVADPCHGCGDRYLDYACCPGIPVLPPILPRRVRKDLGAMDLLDAAFEEPATQRTRVRVAYGPFKDW